MSYLFSHSVSSGVYTYGCLTYSLIVYRPVLIVTGEAVHICSQLFTHPAHGLARDVVSIIKTDTPERSLFKTEISAVSKGYTPYFLVVDHTFQQVQFSRTVIHKPRQNFI